MHAGVRIRRMPPAPRRLAFLVLALVAGAGRAQDDPAEDFTNDPSRPDYEKALATLGNKRWVAAQRAFERFIERWPESPFVVEAIDRSGDNRYLGVDVLHESGPPSRRIDVAVMGDGFTDDASGQNKQEKWAKLCLDVLWSEESFSEYRDYFNFYFVRLASLEEGVDPSLSPEELKRIEEKNRYRRGRRKKTTDYSTALDAKAAGLPMLDRMYKEHEPGTAPPALEALAGKIRSGMVVISSTLSVGPIADALDAEGTPTGPAGEGLARAFPRFADDLAWWTEAAKAQRARRAPPY